MAPAAEDGDQAAGAGNSGHQGAPAVHVQQLQPDLPLDTDAAQPCALAEGHVSHCGALQPAHQHRQQRGAAAFAAVPQGLLHVPRVCR